VCEVPPVAIYVPELPAARPLSIAPASGIVGRPVEPGRVLVYYEGNLNGAVNLQRWEDRVICAAGRLLTHASTVAVATVEATWMRQVGHLMVCDKRIQISDQQSLGQWLAAGA
jgi:hypothetical protein